MTSQPPDRSSSGSEAADAVAAVLADQKEREDRRSRPVPRRGRNRGPFFMGLAAVLAALLGWMLLAPPAFVRPPAPPEPTPARAEATLRMQVYLAVVAVERYSEENEGRIPADLGQALGPAASDSLVLEILPDGAFRVVGRRGDLMVEYHSSEPVSELLRRARPLLEGVGP